MKRTTATLPVIVVLAFILVLSSVQNAFAAAYVPSPSELQYDDSDWDLGKGSTGESVGTGGYLGVRFSLPAPWSSGRLVTARYMVANDEYAYAFRVHVYDSDGSTELCCSPHLDVTPSAGGWVDVDLRAINVVVPGVFWIALECLHDYRPYLRFQSTGGKIDDRSYRIESTGQGGHFPDWVQQTVKDYGIRAVVEAGVDSSTGAGFVSFDTGGSGLESLSAVSMATPPEAGNLVFPYGFFSFTIEVTNPGDSAVVTLKLPSNAPVGTQYWKYGPTPTDPTDHWYQLPIGDDDGDNVITITLTDNGLGDDILTGEGDGQIVDQGGPGVPVAPVAPTTTPTYAAIPEYPLGLILLALLIPVVYGVIKRKARPPATRISTRES